MNPANRGNGRGRWLAHAAPLVSALLAGCVTTGSHTCTECSDSCMPGETASEIKYYGKCSKRDCAWLPKGAIPPPNGTYTHQIFEAQAANAEAGDFVIWECEWTPDGATPAPFGEYHLNEIAKRLPEVPFPVVIQVHADETLNQKRRNGVVQFLASQGITDADQRVILGFPREGGLYGDEAAVYFLRGFTGLNRGRGGYGGYGGYGNFGGFYGNGLFGGLNGGFFGGIGGLGRGFGGFGGFGWY